MLLGNVSLNERRPDAPRLRETATASVCDEILDDRLEIGLGLRVVDAGLQPPEQMHVPDALDDPPALERDWQVDVGAAPHESLRHDADDRPHLCR